MPPIGNLHDNFNDNSLDVSTWLVQADNGASVQETNQRIEITPAESTVNSHGAFYSVNSYDLTNDKVHIEVIQTPTSSANNTSLFGLYTTAGTFVEPYWILYAGSLSAKVNLASSSSTLASFTHNSTTHRWWRIRHSTGYLHWETSSDGLTWTNHASFAHASAVDNIATYVSTTANNSLHPGALYFDNFNMFSVPVLLTGTSGITPTPKAVHYPSITLTGTSAVNVYGTLDTEHSSTTKSYIYKIYDTDDNFLGIWDDVIPDFAYSQEINSAGSSIQVELARTSDTRFVAFDDLYTTQTPEAITTTDGDTLRVGSESINNIGPGSDVDVNYRVEVWVFYGSQESLETTSGELILTNDNQEITLSLGSVNGLRKFNGYITRYVSRYGSTDTVLVSIASFGRELDHYVLKSGSNTTVTYNSTAPNAILALALDNFNSQGGLVSYSDSSISATGTTVSYTFRLNTILEVIKKCLELAPYDWYWYVGLGDNTVYFMDRPTTPSHYFVLGQHIESLDLEYNIEEITNLVYFTGDETADVPLFKTYTDATSIANYRQGLKRISDHRVTLSASADLISEGEIDRNDTPRYRSSITILSEAYNIEEIYLGQLVGFRNFGNYIDDVTLQIVAIDYEPDKVTLQLDTLLPRVNKRIEDLTRNMIELDNQNLPTAPS